MALTLLLCHHRLTRVQYVTNTRLNRRVPVNLTNRRQIE